MIGSKVAEEAINNTRATEFYPTFEFIGEAKYKKDAVERRLRARRHRARPIHLSVQPRVYSGELFAGGGIRFVGG